MDLAQFNGLPLDGQIKTLTQALAPGLGKADELLALTAKVTDHAPPRREVTVHGL